MAAIVIAVGTRSASSLSYTAEAGDPANAVRTVARKLLAEGRLPSLPVHITDRLTGRIIDRIASLAAAADPATRFRTSTTLPQERARPVEPVRSWTAEREDFEPKQERRPRKRGQRGGVKHRERSLRAGA